MMEEDEQLFLLREQTSAKQTIHAGTPKTSHHLVAMRSTLPPPLPKPFESQNAQTGYIPLQYDAHATGVAVLLSRR
ncbi:hypothetical protein D9615_006443 [Tricholomella constricta]|uniref:Uncharacterized protein n=1 Tax=Tricholomella constricta TaxID=117010 RepID=A0A8H5H614_9AGAR|nr:hypothetical protein D9615_006443 [Tricholomella constricta]